MTLLSKRTPFTTTPTPLDTFFNQFFTTRDPWMTRFEETTEGYLPLDISETDKEVVVRAWLPGFKKNEVNVEVHDNVLTITARHDKEKEFKDENFITRERSWGALMRRFELPTAVDEGKAWAELVNGELTLRLHKAPNAFPHRIDIS
ncbi:MAG: Hsp20/alpha crystallin family protein [Planctomycetota bacterium]|jgi:HSP20 family protein